MNQELENTHKFTGDFEKYLKGEPLNPQLAALMAGEDEEEPAANSAPIARESTPLTEPLTDDDREHLRRLLLEPGWRVLMQLLDTDIGRKEDAAKRQSLSDPLSASLNAVWADVAYAKKAKSHIVALAEAEVEKLRLAKKVQKPRHELGATHDPLRKTE